MLKNKIKKISGVAAITTLCWILILLPIGIAALTGNGLWLLMYLGYVALIIIVACILVWLGGFDDFDKQETWEYGDK